MAERKKLTSNDSWSMAGRLDINTLLSFSFGVIFLSVMLVFASFFPNPTDIQIRVFITVLAIAAAGTGAMIPGIININIGKIVRGSGAIGLFAVVYLSEPAITRTVVTTPEPRQEAEPPAREFLRLLDMGEAGAAWDSLDPAGQGRIERGREGFLELYRNVRVSIGQGQNRILINKETYENPSGYPPGRYRTMVFRGYFAETNSCRIETVGLRAVNENRWAVTNYLISMMSVPCQ